MKNEKLQRKMKLEYKAYDKDKKFDNFSEEERDLILAVALGDFRIRLRKNAIRNAVKEEIWKAVLIELHSNKNESDIEKKRYYSIIGLEVLGKENIRIICYN
jgi:hypothetical protein